MLKLLLALFEFYAIVANPTFFHLDELVRKKNVSMYDILTFKIRSLETTSLQELIDPDPEVVLVLAAVLADSALVAFVVE